MKGTTASLRTYGNIALNLDKISVKGCISKIKLLELWHCCLLRKKPCIDFK